MLVEIPPRGFLSFSRSIAFHSHPEEQVEE
jgi:hypothetical protein